MSHLNLTTDTATMPCLQAHFNVVLVTLKKPQGKHQI